MTEFGLKELYEVIIRTTYPIEVSGKTIEAGEAIGVFDKIQIANIQEIKNSVAARGGWDNRGLVYWDSTREVRISLVQGIFSKAQFNLMTAAKWMDSSKFIVKMTAREALESDEEGVITTSHQIAEQLFVYKVATGEKLTYTMIDDTHIQIETPYTDVCVDYLYKYDDNLSLFTVGQALTTGFLSLEGKTRVKDDITGQTHTGVLYIPKLKLMSDLSMRLGHDATPQVGRLDAVAVPIGDRRNTQVMHVMFLDDDIDSDM